MDSRTRTKPLGGSNRLLTMRQAADRLGISYTTFKRHYRDWNLQPRPVGQRKQFLERDIEHFMLTRTG